MGGCRPLKGQSDIEALPGCRPLRWYEHPELGRVPSGMELTEWDGSNLYRFTNGQHTQTVGVDVGDVTAKVYTCTRNDMDVNFREGGSVLRCQADPLANVVHLRFNPPVRAVGTHVTGNWKDGREYMVAFTLGLQDGTKSTPYAIAPRGKFSSQRSTAPFVGAQADADNLITEMYCDIYLTDCLIDDQADVLISDVYFVPNNTGKP